MLIDRLIGRGLISGIYPASTEYRAKLSQILIKPATVYTGFDATGKSLHVGHLATIVNSLYFQSQGHQVICVIGDATAQVGDPSGHTKDRERIPKSVIQDNAKSIESCLKRLFKNFRNCFLATASSEELSIHPSCANESIQEPIIIRNSEWYQGENVVGFVDRIFRDVRVGGLLHKKSIQERLKSQDGMNMAEFAYQIFQAYDWLELRRRYNCKLQIGGNDQQGNIYTGHDLIKKIIDDNDSIGLLAPLITNAKGKKLGKTTASKAGIWLEPDLTSPFDLYQFFLKTIDDDVDKFLRIFSFHSDSEIDEMIQKFFKNKSDIRHCQRRLAEHACLLVHGEEGLSDAKRITESLFSNKARNQN